MKRHVLDQIESPDLRAYVVWLPVQSRLSAEGLAGAARSAANRIADERVTHFLAPEPDLGLAYGPVIHLPQGEPAWDVYFVFEPGVRWEEELPRPSHWMHQLAAAPPERRLDARKLATVIEGLLAKVVAVQ